MLNRLRGLLSVFCLILILASCSKKVENEQLLRAEILMHSSVDSSYLILQSISPDILTKPEQMYYGLLLAETMDKKYLSLLPCDSLLNEAIHYYGSGINRAKALMYKGRLQNRMNMYKEAIESDFAALKELGGTDGEELRIKGMIYEDLGNLYVSQVLIDKGMDMFLKSQDCFIRCNYKKGLCFVSNDIGWTYLLKGDTLRARDNMKYALGLALGENDSMTVSMANHNLSCAYKEVDSMLFYGKRSLAFGKRMAAKAAIMVGYAFMNHEQLDSADYYFRQALQDTVIETKALALYGLKDVMEMKGDYQQALGYLDNYSVTMNSIFDKQNPEVEQKIYEYEAKMKVYKEKVQMQILFIGLAVLCLLIILFMVWYIQRIKRRRDFSELEHKYDRALLEVDIVGLQYYVSSLRREQEEDKRQISQKECEIRKLADEKGELCNVIFKETSIYKKIERLSHQEKTKNKQELRILLENEQKQLRSTVMEIYKGYIDYLYQTYPKYTENDCLFSCLSLCGLDDFTIALCFGNVNKQIVVQRRHRIKLKTAN
ncbi:MULTISPECIES: hypothetical protein [Bacteroides]|jgi:tetratricopeptide (TPR) repeat protein|uniref:hypothetical protein n=1 Tax=Bacteroides TaxID=816 RepID=UPI001652B5AA|nr:MULTISPECIES: hypothetical protein [Bacteroides]